MPIEQYWIGKGLDLEEVWSDYDQGAGYIAKVASTRSHLLRLVFQGQPNHLPLFDHEAIYKTVKGTFHDVKAECLSPQAYDAATPIFLYRIDRGSGIFEFLAELQPLFPYLAALGATLMWYRAAFAKDADLDEKNWNFIKSNFPKASDSDRAAYMKAWTTWGRRNVLARLVKQGLHRVEVSREAITDGAKVPQLQLVVIFDVSQLPGKKGDV